jgi:hypothetical protein
VAASARKTSKNPPQNAQTPTNELHPASPSQLTIFKPLPNTTLSTTSKIERRTVLSGTLQIWNSIPDLQGSAEPKNLLANSTSEPIFDPKPFKKHDQFNENRLVT